MSTTKAMIIIPKGIVDVKVPGIGAWQIKSFGSNQKFLLIRCPKCQHDYVLGRGEHTIDDNGIVHPSVVCASLNCDFHEYVQLDKWADRER